MLGNNKSHKFHPVKILVMLSVFLGVVAVASYVVMFLWNNILAEVTNVKPLNFWQAAGLLILSKLIFSGFGGKKRRHKWKKRQEWREKWMHMNQEERQAAKARWKEYCESKKSE